VGHVAIARAAIDCVPLDEVLLVPAALPPHRRAAVAGAEDRLAMSRLAVQGEPRISVSDIELKRSTPSFTVDTLEQLAAERPGDELYLVLGWDAAREIRSWREPDRVLDMATLVVVSRPGLPAPTRDDLQAAGIDPARTVLCDVPTPPVQATAIRDRVAAGGSLDGLLAPAVAEYVLSHGLYARA
jgi:nicotinate-nucleotide adenylyltransferase